MFVTVKMSKGVFVRVLDRSEHWFDSNEMLHRDNGIPAIIQNNDYEAYYIHGVFQYRKWKGKT